MKHTVDFLTEATPLGLVRQPDCPHYSKFKCKVGSGTCISECRHRGGLNSDNSNQVICHYPDDCP